jgi:hypothetical protein
MENFENRQYLYEYVKQEIDNMDFFNSYMKMKKVGLVYRAMCPFHNEKTASLTVYPYNYINKNEKQKYASFYCFGCGAAGDIIKFKQLKDNINSYYEAALQLSIEYKLNVENENEIKLNYLKNKINITDNSNNLSLDKINLLCSTIIRNYMRIHNNEDDINKINDYYKYLDNELNERNAIQAQDLINETIEKFKI